MLLFCALSKNNVPPHPDDAVRHRSPWWPIWTTNMGPRAGSHMTPHGNPLVSKCDFLLIIIPHVELLRTVGSLCFSLWAVCVWGGHLSLSPSPPAAAPLGAHACAQPEEWRRSRWDDNSPVLSAGAAAALAAPLNGFPWSPTARWCSADKAQPRALALHFTPLLNHSLSASRRTGEGGGATGGRRLGRTWKSFFEG